MEHGWTSVPRFAIARAARGSAFLSFPSASRDDRRPLRQSVGRATIAEQSATMSIMRMLDRHRGFPEPPPLPTYNETHNDENCNHSLSIHRMLDRILPG